MIDIDFEVYGFDTGSGLPEPKGYRDLPYHWQKGFYNMDKEELEKKLSISKLVIGDTRETCPKFFDSYTPAPIGCIFVDLDFYSSTVEALKIFDSNFENYLPRVFCYFDDVTGTEIELYNEFSGELAAIRVFNEDHSDKKICKLRCFTGRRKFPHVWNEMIYAFHDFDHPKYNHFVSESDQQLPLSPKSA